ncbi:uncharacterized protein LOC128964591 [Oppia nitens]|uniref:uncharacterized protein LOC128964591 n=1 Tax=Oppia nitens TaxID=1686743 RepID=UPI0023DC020E|nr:uncharacterized protein LOC128964591 [Oppia nitens]
MSDNDKSSDDKIERKKSSDGNGGEEKITKVKSSASVESQSSKRSLGMGPSLRMASTDIREITKESQSVSQAGRLTAEGGSPPGEAVFDTLAYIIYCPDHQKIAISRSDKDKPSWLPFIACPNNKTWKDASIDGVSIIFNRQDAELDAKLGTKIPTKDERCLQVFRTQMPDKRFKTLVVWFVALGNEDKGKKDKSGGRHRSGTKSNKEVKSEPFKCCQPTKRIHWIPVSEAIAGKIDKVWGPEVQNFAKIAKQDKPTDLSEESLDRAMFYVPKDQPRNVEQALVKGAGIGNKEAQVIYEDFIQHCFPSLSMSFDSFKDYMIKYLEDYTADDDRFPLLYNAFNYNKNNCLDFHEMLLGVASMEPSAPNAEARLKFVFRYYDTNNDGKLSSDEFKKLVKAMSVGSDENSINNKVREAWTAMGATDTVDVVAFCKAVSEQKFRGTSALCRVTKPIVPQITQSQTTLVEKKATVKKKAGFLMQNRRNRGVCFACRGKKYDYGLHSIKLDTTGSCVEPRRIFEPEASDNKVISEQRYSIDFTFNTRSIANIFVDLMRDFSRKKDKDKGFLFNDRETLINYLEALSSDLIGLFGSEDRCIKLNSPAFVFGNIFGSLDDLLTFENDLWQSFPVISAHYLFLGNVVDKGKWSLECAIYLFALKMLAPTKFILLRGKHESREYQQKRGTFLKDCTTKYGDKAGQKIWELMNSMFDRMPLCTIIDESIFCAPSGVSPKVTKLDNINSVTNDLKNPATDEIAWGLMAGEVKEDVIKGFLAKFEFSHMIRSNKLSDNRTKLGYEIQFGGKCLSITSNSNMGTESVAVFVDSDKIRIICLETTNAKGNGSGAAAADNANLKKQSSKKTATK